MEWILLVATFSLLGGLVGTTLMKLIYPTKPIGTLRIDTSDPDGPFIFLELDKGVGDFYKKSHITLRISTENYISQK